jgi:DNA-binding transcriptional ArsR family regulator
MSAKEQNPLDLNKVIHERIRLGIMSVLSASEEVSFNELKEKLATTDGNLSVHARVLEDAGYIKIEKKFVERKPLTAFRITGKGKKEFVEYLAKLKDIIKKG